MILDQLFDLINECKTIAIFTHVNADGDAIGSSMAMKYMLENLNKKVYVFIQKPISENYFFMGINSVVDIGDKANYDLAIGLDVPNIRRFGIYEEEFKKAKKSINIDHHLENNNFANINIVDTTKSSTCEIIFDIFMKKDVKISSIMATCLYSGIATDTGRFSHSNTSAASFYACSKLVEFGADLQVLNYNLFNHIKLQEFNIYREALNNVEFYENGKIVFVGITKKMLNKCKAGDTDTFRIIDYINGLDGTEIAILMTQRSAHENLVSVRTKGRNAQSICKAFGGGGHLLASGCRIFVPFDEAKKQLINECRRELSK